MYGSNKSNQSLDYLMNFIWVEEINSFIRRENCEHYFFYYNLSAPVSDFKSRIRALCIFSSNYNSNSSYLSALQT